MEYLTVDYVSGLILEQSIRKNNRRKRIYAINGTVYSGKPPVEVIGKFEGKAGTIRRSRKGATRRLPNGRRPYIAPIPFDEAVSWYKP